MFEPKPLEIRIQCPPKKIDIMVRLGDGPATPTAGFASWEVVDRVEGKGVTDRVGAPPFQQDVPIFLDGYAKDNSIQGQLNTLLRLGGPDAVPFRCTGPIHKPHLRYVFGGEPEFGEAIRDDSEDDGRLLRQRVTLHLLEYVSPDTIRRRKRKIGISNAVVASHAMGLSDAVPLSATVRAGDNLQTIVARELGDWTLWQEVGRKNGIRDPFKKLDPGRVIRL